MVVLWRRSPHTRGHSRSDTRSYAWSRDSGRKNISWWRIDRRNWLALNRKSSYSGQKRQRSDFRRSWETEMRYWQRPLRTRASFPSYYVLSRSAISLSRTRSSISPLCSLQYAMAWILPSFVSSLTGFTSGCALKRKATARHETQNRTRGQKSSASSHDWSGFWCEVWVHRDDGAEAFDLIDKPPTCWLSRLIDNQDNKTLNLNSRSRVHDEISCS